MNYPVLQRIKLCAVLLLCSHSYAADDTDTRLRLEQNLLEQDQEQQQDLKQQQQQDRRPQLAIHGEIIDVQPNEHDVGQALYVAVMQKHWQAVQYYLKAYVALAMHDVSLAEFAQGALAYAEAKPEQAEQHFNQALQLQPNNVMIQLELARLLTEQHKNKEAIALFKRAQAQVSHVNDNVAQNILRSIDVYLKGLSQRDAWQGSLSVGTRSASNINSSSDKTSTWTRYIEDQNGNKLPVEQVSRTTPKKISALAFDYEAAVNKRWSLYGQHGMALKSFVYGRSYLEHQDFNEMTLSVHAGYSFQNQKQQIVLAPLYEHHRYQNDSFSNAWGARAEWMNLFGPKQALKLEAEAKHIEQNVFKEQSGLERSAYVTYWKMLNPTWTVFTGLDVVDHNTEEQYFSAYMQHGLRLGLSKQFKTGFQATLFSSFRWREYDQYNAVLLAKRSDFEQNYNVVFSAPKWQFHGVTPNLSYQYNRNQSNVDWLYSYDKHQISMKLEYRF